MSWKIVAPLLYLFFLTGVKGQNDSSNLSNYKSRRIIFTSSASVLTAGSLVYLNQAWYSEYRYGKFHFFNDNKEWLQMDKVGHFFSNYQVSRLTLSASKWASYTRNQQLMIGASIGLGYMTVIEIMDGYSKGWGFSWGDEVANVLGTAAAVSQHAFWAEKRIQIKYSYTPSGLAKYNPALLGKDWRTQFLKDYNGQTLWISVNPSAFIKRETKFPKWLNVALGYGAYGMLGGFANNITVLDNNGNKLTFERNRRVYLSLDIDLTRIPTKSKFLKQIFSVVNVLKIPAPAIRFSENNVKGFLLFF